MDEGKRERAATLNEAAIDPGDQGDLAATANRGIVTAIAIRHLPIGALPVELALAANHWNNGILSQSHRDRSICAALQGDAGDMPPRADKIESYGVLHPASFADARSRPEHCS
jgi:hypothetical protein